MKRNAQDIIQQIKPVKSAKKCDSTWKDFMQYTKLDPSEDNFKEYSMHGKVVHVRKSKFLQISFSIDVSNFFINS